MLALLIATIVGQGEEVPDRISAIYRCPAKEGETERLQRVVDSLGYDTLCIDPKPGPSATQAAKGKLKFIKPSEIDTRANLKWRNATIAFVEGKISPQAWLSKTKGLGETVHFLTNPAKPELRTLTGNLYRAVFAEMLLLSWRGRPCITSGDSWNTRPLPDAGPLQSWVLAMNDWLGPLLQFRFEHPFMVKREPTILRADAKPGLLIFRQSDGMREVTVYCNNSAKTVELPKVNLDGMTINKGVIAEDAKTSLTTTGFLILER